MEQKTNETPLRTFTVGRNPVFIETRDDSVFSTVSLYHDKWKGL